MKLISLILIGLWFFIGDSQAQSFLDTTFNHIGIRQIDTGGCNKLLIQGDKKIISLGGFKNGNLIVNILQWKENGSLDLSFANNVQSNLIQTSSPHSLVISSSNNVESILVCGEIDVSNTATDFHILKLNMNGTLDQSFGINGSVITNLVRFQYGVWFTHTQDYATSLALQDSGKIIVLGRSDGDLAMVRYTAEGKVDSTFGINGIVAHKIGTYASEPNDIEILSDNRIVVGFRASINDQGAMCAMRFLPDGTIDSSFNQTGLAYVNNGWLTYCNALSLQPDGKVLLAGYSDSALIVRFDTAGLLDPTFGNGGICKLPPAAIRDMVLAPDGKVLVTGTCDDDFVIYRCLSNGTLDTTFGNNGIIMTNVENGEEDRAESIALQADGKILVGGSSVFPNSYLPEFVIARYLPEGQTDLEQIPSQQSVFMLYPNPAEDAILLSWKELASSAQIDILDVYGRTLIVLKDQLLNAAPVQIDISALTPGIYFVNVRAKNGLNGQQKFIKK